MARGKKDPFDDLDTEWKDMVGGMSIGEIRDRIAEVSLNEMDNQRNKEDDQDLSEKHEAYKSAGAQYSEATAANKLRLKFLRRVLGDKGGR